MGTGVEVMFFIADDVILEKSESATIALSRSAYQFSADIAVDTHFLSSKDK